MLHTTRSLLDKARGFDQALVFPGVNNNSVLNLIRKQMSEQATIHGFRSTFRDWAGDCTSWDRETIEFSLAHGITDATEAAYRRGTAVEKRRKLMQSWADFCDAQVGENIIQMRREIPY